MSPGWLQADSAPPLDRAVARIEEISTLPHVALRVMEVANDPDSSAADLKEVMESDAALSARVLRCVNSSAYGLRERISNLQQGIAYLGLKQIRNLAVTASVSELFRSGDTIGSYSRSGLWRHLVSVGVGARLIALRRKLNDFEDAFLAGLLHDIGIILEDQYLHRHFRRVVESLDGTRPLGEVEREKIGYDHCVLGGRVAEQWKFPALVLDAIRYHHNSANYRGEQRTLLHCVEMANLICTLKGITSVGFKLVQISPEAMKGLSLSREDILVLAEDLDDEIARHGSLFEL